MRKRVFAVLLISACTVGTVGTSGPPGGGGGPDASSGGGDGPTGSIDAPAGSGSGSGSNGCLNQSANLPDGHHNPGQDCMNGCHNHGFTLSGTIYTSVNSNTAVVGATVVATDANNQVIKMVTATNGNFYTTSPVTFPVTVLATECPNITPMSAQLTSGQGGCNKVGCHTAGAQGHIHLP